MNAATTPGDLFRAPSRGDCVRVSRSHLDQVETVLGTVLWVKREGSALTVGLESTPEQSGTRDGLLITAIWKPEYAWLVVHREVPRALVHRSHFGG